MIRIALLLCRTRYRKQALNNFSRTSIYGNILILSFCGPFLFLFGKLISRINIFKSISIDANPVIKSSAKGINFWFGGTSLKIPQQFLKLDNNYVNMKNNFRLSNTQNQDRVFQLYPLINRKDNKYEGINRKIVFVSSIRTNLDKTTYDFWNENKKKFLQNMSLFNSMKDFEQSNIKLNKNQKFRLFREIQTLIRIEIVKKIYSEFKNRMIIIGSSWNEILKIETEDIFSKKKREKLYKNNICLDLGSNGGSLSLYPRSIEILENNGALIQLEQQDSDVIYKKNNNDFKFNNIENLINKINQLLKNDICFSNHINKQNILFLDSKKKIADQLETILN